MKKAAILKRIIICFCFFIFSLANASPQSALPDEKTINYIINTDESTVVDQILYRALERIGYGMTMDAMPMIYAIQMANSGERDALAVHARGTELTYPNLVMVPESIVEVGFQVYAPAGAGIVIKEWNDLSGLTVGHLFQKRRIIDEMPRDIAGSIQRETFYELNMALLAGECDVIVTTSTFDKKLIAADGIEYLTTIDTTLPVTFLNKKYEALAPDLAESLREMKADGTYDKIVNGEWRPAGSPFNILHISSFYPEDLWDARLKDGIMSALGGGAHNEVMYYNIPLYSNRFRAEYEQARNAYYSLRTMIMLNPPDVIIATDRSAVSFVCNYYYPLFTGIPVILCDVNDNIDNLWQLGGNYAALWQAAPAEDAARLIKKLFPKTEELFVINDFTANGEAWRADIEKTLGANFAGMDVKYNKSPAFSETLKEISALNENAAVLIGHCAADAQGSAYFSGSLFDSIARAREGLPVFEMKYGRIGDGQIGGKYIDPAIQGAMLGAIALEIMAKSPPASPPVSPPEHAYAAGESARWIFDEAVIKELGISKRRFPSGAEYINRKITIYELNPQAFIITVILIPGLLVFILLLYRNNRRLLETQKTVLQQENSLDNLENILNGLKAMICVTDPETDETIFVNDNMREELAVEKDYAGKKCFQVLRKNQERCGFCPCYDLDKEPEKVLVWEEPLNKNGKVYRSYSRYIIWPNGKRAHLQLAVDITDIKSAQDELTKKSLQLETALKNEENANRVKSAFLAAMSHEIRTPMNVIMGSTESLLETDAPNPKEIKSILEKIYNSGGLLLQIINDILDLSKIEANKFEIIPVKYETASLINDTINLNIMKYAQKEIKFIIQVDENLPRFLFGDELRIKQIINNLLSNAFKYTEAGTITASFARESVSPDKMRLVIRISDTGQGMTKEQVKKLFNEYTRFNLDANRTTEGAGLGLAITRNLVKMMDGEIDVESAEGKGSVFTVRLPQGIIDERLLGAENSMILENFRFNDRLIKKKEKIEKTPMPYGKVLIVDDMKSNIDVALLLLKPYQLQIETALSGYEAIDLIKSGKEYDIIFMDHMMPKMDGIETVKLMRESGYPRAIIALTANAIVGQAEMFKANGFDGCITKPIDTRELNAALNEHIRDKEK